MMSLLMSATLGVALNLGGVFAPQETPRMKVFTSAFENGKAIPETYKSVSPELGWDSVPSTAKSFALIVHDPDAPAGSFVHWVVFNIPGTRRHLAQGEASVGVAGTNNAGSTTFAELNPPAAAEHRYFFTLYALDRMLDLQPGASKDDVARAMQGHIVGIGQLMGTFGRRE